MKEPIQLMNFSKNEAYKYFDLNIRKLPKDSSGEIDETAPGFSSNDVDAFRHAYVSGVFTQEYSEETSEIFGSINELLPWDLYSNQKNPNDMNMDLWNNSIARKYGKKTKNSKELLKIIHHALKNGRNLIFYVTRLRKVLTAEEFIILIESGKYPSYTVKLIKGKPTPVSLPDGQGSNNLG